MAGRGLSQRRFTDPAEHGLLTVNHNGKGLQTAAPEPRLKSQP
jgi:hypothetical protein